MTRLLVPLKIGNRLSEIDTTVAAEIFRKDQLSGSRSLGRRCLSALLSSVADSSTTPENSNNTVSCMGKPTDISRH